MALLPIRTFGDPVLKQRTPEVETVDESIVRLVDDMIETMRAAPGVGLAAPQVGVQKRLFVYDVGDGPRVVINPVISDHRGEWTYEEGCLSVPSLFWPVVRPGQVHLRGRDLDGRELSIEADELLARVFQHEVDHLDGMLLLERLDSEQRKEAMRTLRERTLSLPGNGRPAGR
ncbi:MAG TPA: peptide deformylase [Acidimicrobiales bacterium]